MLGIASVEDRKWGGIASVGIVSVGIACVGIANVRIASIEIVSEHAPKNNTLTQKQLTTLCPYMIYNYVLKWVSSKIETNWQSSFWTDFVFC